MQRYSGWKPPDVTDLAEPTFHELLQVWAAEAEAIRRQTPGKDGKTPAPEPDEHTDLRTLAAAQGFMVPEDDGQVN